MATKKRVVKAITAMKEIGIPEETVKRVLKSLLKLYDNKWELIEEENYRALADAIFQNDDDKIGEAKKIDEDHLQEDSGPPSKRLRSKDRDEDSPSAGDSSRETSLRSSRIDEHMLEMPPGENRAEQSQSLLRERRSERDSVEQEESQNQDKINEPSSVLNGPRLERAEPSRQGGLLSSPTCPEHDKEEQSCPSLRGNRGEPDSASLRPRIITKGKGLVSSQFVSRGKKLVKKGGRSFNEAKSDQEFTNLSKEKPSNSHHPIGLIVPKSEPFTDDLPRVEVPMAAVHPHDSGPGRGEDAICSGRSNSNAPSKGATNLEAANIPESPSADFEIASSPFGEVKISLSFNSSIGRSKFRAPSLDTVVKMVEEKCLRSYKIVLPNFSLVMVMKELCKCFLEVGTYSTEDDGEKMVMVTPILDSLKKACSLGFKLSNQGNLHIPGSSFNCLSDICSSSGMVVPKLPRIVPMDGVNCVVQPNQNIVEKTFGVKDKKKDHQSFQSSSSSSLVVIQEKQTSLDQVRPLHDVYDISKGEERVRITVVNDISKEPYPPSFYYIPQNIVYQNAYINFSLARIGDEDCCSKCFGDCMSSSIPCACARETGGEFAYTVEGLVNEKLLDKCISLSRNPEQHHFFYCNHCPLERSQSEGLHDKCNGHLVRKFIKECWSKCGCNKQCGNRVVQRGITCNLQVFLTPEGKGWGIRTLEDLPKGAFVCEYVGEILTNTELYERNERSTGTERHTYPVLLDADWGSEGVLKDEEALCLDATLYGNVARFINHRCSDANMIEIPVEVENPDHHYYHLAFFTTRKVDRLEELTWDYGIDFEDHNHPVKAFNCRCGSKGCRNVKKPKRSKSRTLILR